ncbi:MAG: hypothetical protein ACEPO8_05790 [Rhodothermaceae bacterium]
MKNLLIVEINRSFPEKFLAELTSSFNLEVRKVVESDTESLQNLYPDLVILFSEKTESDHSEILKILKHNFSDIPIILIDNYELSEEGLNALKTGATGYFSLKEKDFDIIRIVSNSINGEVFIPKVLAEELASPFVKISGLKKIKNNFFTTRELVFLTLLKDAESYSIIADKLNVSIDKINFLVRNIYRKLHFYHNVSEVI